jgi:uncharacterized protein (TIGR03643 family)
MSDKIDLMEQKTSLNKASSKSIILSEIEIDRIIEMAWEDRTPFDAIEFQFGLREADVKELMKKNLKMTSYKLWRKRVHNCNTKHVVKRSVDISRFKCTLQRAISMNKISKR